MTYTYVRHDSFTGAFVIGIYIALLALVSAICIRVHTSRKRARETWIYMALIDESWNI